MAVKRSKSKTALRGAVNNIIMESLYEGEKYGYEIIKEVEEKTKGKIKLKQPSLYSSLSRFESKGLITSYWQDSDIGGKRHYYKLTDAGIDHYKKKILKEELFDEDETKDDFIKNLSAEKTDINDDEEYIEDKLNEYEIDDHEETQDISKYEYDVDAKIKSLLGEDDDKSTDEDVLDELYENKEETIFTEADLIEDTSYNSEEIINDHEFRSSSPLIEIIEESEAVTRKISNEDYTENAYNDIMESSSDDIFDDIDLDNEYERVEEPTPTINETTTIKQQSKPRIITDENGITKMYYEDSLPKKHNDKIFDNVVYRTNSNDNIFKARATATRKVQEKELSEEEKEQKSRDFMERFDIKTEQLKREKQINSPTPPAKPEQKIDYNYKSKLNDLFSYGEDDEEESFISQEVEYDEYTPQYNFSVDNDEGSFDDQTDIDEYSTQLNDNGYSIKVFTEEKKKTPTVKYLQVNRAKFAFGLYMLVFMLVQLTIMLFVFKNKELLSDDQFWVFQVSYIIIAIIALIYCVPVFISPNKQSSNTFKLTYSLMFGLLAFFNIVIVTYAINTFMGMDLKSIKYYLVTLIVPIAMALNFVFGPLIYWLITQNKKYYN